jgi:regulator of sigma E protease
LAFLSFLIVFGIVSMVHELGHFLVGKLFKFRILEFAIGFGPALIKKIKGETTYCLRILPLGGLNRFDDGEEGRPADSRSFANRPFYQRFLVILSGSIMNILLAIVIVTSLFAITGTPVISIADTIPGSPAEAAGIQKGDIILSIDGKAMLTSESIVSVLSASSDKQVDITVEREGNEVVIAVTPKLDPADARGKIGIYMEQVLKKTGFLKAISNGTRFLAEIIKLTLIALGRVITGNGLDQISGPVGIAVASAEAAKSGMSSFVLLIALISVSLGVFNLLPLPILDGGWLLFMSYERITGRKIPDRLMYALKVGGIALFIALAVFATYSDIARLIVGR